MRDLTPDLLVSRGFGSATRQVQSLLLAPAFCTPSADSGSPPSPEAGPGDSSLLSGDLESPHTLLRSPPGGSWSVCPQLSNSLQESPTGLSATGLVLTRPGLGPDRVPCCDSIEARLNLVHDHSRLTASIPSRANSSSRPSPFPLPNSYVCDQAPLEAHRQPTMGLDYGPRLPASADLDLGSGQHVPFQAEPNQIGADSDTTG